MTHQVYGLRQRGTNEIRYVGYTAAPLNVRLARHLAAAKWTHLPADLHRWLVAYEDALEIFPVWEAESKADALVAERVAIKHCISIGQPLLNQTFVPLQSRPRLTIPPERAVKMGSTGLRRAARWRRHSSTGIAA